MAKIKHGKCGTPTYRIWVGMRTRCNNPKVKEYPNYGGRGIKCCARWEDFELFLIDMGFRPPGMTIERIDNNGHYEPGNCRWATLQEQTHNLRKNVRVTFEGETLDLSQWAKKRGIPYQTLRRRFHSSKTPEQILSLEDLPPDIEKARDVMLAARRAATHCKHGHEFTAGNTIQRPNGTRACRQCQRDRGREFQRAKRKRLS